MADLKEAAAHAALNLIKDSKVVGLGAGSTITHLVKLMRSKVGEGSNKEFVTASAITRSLLVQQAFTVVSASELSAIDIYFDGCDQVDRHLNALKSGGGIHTMEKLLALMAAEFVIIGDESKLVDHFDLRFPVVLEVLPQAVAYVPQEVERNSPLVRYEYREVEKQGGYSATENGNYLLDCWFREWPELSTLNPLFKSITGVVETSLFYKMAHKVILAGNDGVQTLYCNGKHA